MKNTYLLSYPRSGNTFMRYCLEHLTPYRTIGAKTKVDRDILKKEADHPQLIKTHTCNNVKDNLPLIFILRDFYEIRHNHGMSSYAEAMKRTIRGGTVPFDFFKNLNFFHNYQGEKILIRYEDMMTDKMGGELELLLEFLGCSKENLSEFVENLDDHREKSFTFYTTSEHSHTKKSNNPNLGRNCLSEDERKGVEEILQEVYPTLYEEYLKPYCVV